MGNCAAIAMGLRCAHHMVSAGECAGNATAWARRAVLSQPPPFTKDHGRGARPRPRTRVPSSLYFVDLGRRSSAGGAADEMLLSPANGRCDGATRGSPASAKCRRRRTALRALRPGFYCSKYRRFGVSGCPTAQGTSGTCPRGRSRLERDQSRCAAPPHTMAASPPARQLGSAQCPCEISDGPSLRPSSPFRTVPEGSSDGHASADQLGRHWGSGNPSRGLR